MIVFALMVYAWRSWFVSTCGLILLSVVMQRRDFPSYLMGINGLNAWNLLLLATLVPAFVQIAGGQRKIDVPRSVIILFGTFSFMIFVAYARTATDLGALAVDVRHSFIGFTGDFLINRVKFVLPAALLFVGCRTRAQIRLAGITILLAATCYATLVIKTVPISTIFSESKSEFMRYRHRIDRDIGLMAIDMSMLFAGSCWAIVCFVVLAVKRKLHKVVMLGVASLVFLALLLCHSRGSYVGFAAASFVLVCARWRKAIILFPIGIAAIFTFFPAVPARLGMGLAEQDVSGHSTQNWEEITAGRTTDLWPAAVEQIGREPVFGIGAYASLRPEVRGKWQEIGTAPFHPHNAYLELLLDMGIVGFIPVMCFYGGVFVMTLRLFMSKGDGLAAAIGGMGLANITVLLVTALGAQSFYPTQSTMLHWCSWALALRVSVSLSIAQRARAMQGRALRAKVTRVRPQPWTPGIQTPEASHRGMGA